MTNTVYVAIAALLVISLSSSIVRSDQETIPDRVARGVKGEVRNTPSGAPPPFSEVARHADLVVRGTIGEPHGYLSSNLTDVLTDYPLQHPLILFQSEVQPSAKPGIPPPLAVTISGGEVVVGEAKYTQYEEALPALPVGAEGLFLLKKVDDHYMVAGLFLGAFTITPGGIVPLAHKAGFAEEYRNIPAAEAIGQIVAQVKEMHDKTAKN